MGEGKIKRSRDKVFNQINTLYNNSYNKDEIILKYFSSHKESICLIFLVMTGEESYSKIRISDYHIKTLKNYNSLREALKGIEKQLKR